MIVRIEMPAGGGVAGQPVNAYLVGRQRFVLIDPGRSDGPGARSGDRGGHASGAARIEAVALTHVEPDHAAGAESIGSSSASGLRRPGRRRHLPYEVRELAMAMVIDAGDVPLRVMATPGPRIDRRRRVRRRGRVGAITGDLDGVRGGSIFGGRWTTSRGAAVRRGHLAQVASTLVGSGHPPSTPTRDATRSTAKPYPEARPPHLPDVVTRQSPWLDRLRCLAVVVEVPGVSSLRGRPAAAGIDLKSSGQVPLSWLPSPAGPAARMALLYRQARRASDDAAAGVRACLLRRSGSC